jgi:hypothetical protein
VKITIRTEQICRLPRGLAALSLALAFALAASACVPAQKVAKVERLATQWEKPRVLLMPPDIKFSAMTASGMLEPQADWTQAARENFLAGVAAFAELREVELVRMPENATLSETDLALERLHAVVGPTILINHFGEQKLPTKGGQFDWSLGPSVASLREHYDADYALFSYYRHTQATGGRIAMMVLFAAAGVAIPTGGQGGFGSLVDLNTGDIVWFNNVPVGTGDLRTPEGAATVVQRLFQTLPER